ncbi:MAG: hypothetical protein K6G72_05915 [Lachnospiraceae bacterium]|nr:hypothetical protein [Lachnospiraceae bacterium]
MFFSGKHKFIQAAVLSVVLVLTGAFFCRGEVYAKAPSSTVELFVFAPCESCHEEEKFSEEVEFKLAETRVTDYGLKAYNAYKESGSSRLEEIEEEYGLNIPINELPMAVAGGEVFFGTYSEIGEALGDYLQGSEKRDVIGLATDVKTPGDTVAERKSVTDSVIYRDIRSIGKDETAMLLFVTGSCDSCNRAEEYMKSVLTDGQCSLKIYNIMEDDNAVVLRKLMKMYEVPDSLQQVPLLFTKNGYLSGAEAIKKDALNSLESMNSAGSWDEVAAELANNREDAGFSKIKLMVTGFVNGLNPCGISMLLMVLSVLLMSGKSFFTGSFTYLAGKFLTYLLLGFTLGSLFSVIEGTVFKTVHEAINIVFAVLSLGFGLFYLMDFIHVLKKDYGKERLRLPEGFRRWNHNMIKKLSEVQGRFWYPMLFLLGIVISAGEFLCTGQVYLATLLYMAGQNGAFNGEIAGNLAIYLTAMCVPMILLTVLVSKGKSVMSASHISLKILPAVKLAYSIFFFVLFISLLF